jgi:hypothetical protein
MADDGHRLDELFNAIFNADDATALSIVRGGVDVNGEWDGWTHLCLASWCNRVAVVSCFLELGADVDKNKHGCYTPLGFAAANGHQDVVELLVEVGNAQVDKQDDEGFTALHCAAREVRLEPSKYLVARGCSLTVLDNYGRTALDATASDCSDLVQFLTSASLFSTNNDYSSLRSLCAPFSAPYLKHTVSRLRYTTILAARRARRIHDGSIFHTPIDPFLLRLALLPSADNTSPNTESQVFQRVLVFVGTGFPRDSDTPSCKCSVQ